MQITRYRQSQQVRIEAPPSKLVEFTPDVQAARRVIDPAMTAKRYTLGEAEAKAVLAAYGVPVVQTRVAATPAEAEHLASEIGLPVALKILSSDITHKSDVGGVALDLEDARQVRSAAEAMLNRVHQLRPQARLTGFTVQARARRPQAHELIVGVASDPIFGPDAKLMEGEPLEVDQSALTGESLPVTRAVGDAAYSGSVVKRGEADALVYATGTNTFFGKTAQLVEKARTVSHFQKAVLKIGNFLIVVAVALVILIITVALIRGDRMLTTLQFALVLTVAAIPVALPTVLSVTMAVGARMLAGRQAIVSRRPRGRCRASPFGGQRRNRRLCRTWFPVPGRGSNRRERLLAIPGRAAAV